MKMHEQCLEIRRRVLGAEHPDTLWSMNALAMTYDRMGRSIEAMKMHEQMSGDQKEGIRSGASRHAAEHEWTGGDVRQTGTID